MRGPFVQALILLIVAFLFFKYGIRPPIPSSLLVMYMMITFFAVLLYVSSSEESWREFLRPLKATFLAEEPKTRAIRRALFVLLPLLAGTLAYQRSFPTLEAPAELRAVHPAPPTAIQFRGKTLTIQGLENPLREDAQNLQRYVQEGAEIYAKNCFFCHGDALDGKGPFAQGFNPLPANFTDTGTIAQLQESYVFWRIAKGGPGLPKESTPWNSAMPAWEGRLGEEEIWKVILFLYEAAREYNPGVQPRRWEANVRGDSPFRGLLPSFLTAVAPAPAEAERQDVEAGKKLYETKCAICHGFDGKGDGPAAPYLSPRPRDFTRGLYKIRSTGSGHLPTDEDLFKVITKGMPGTSMPAWDILTEKERRYLVAYIKTFSQRFAAEPPPEPIPEGQPIPPTPESLAKGKELYNLMECFKCHGDEGRADGPSAPELKDEWGFPIRPANLTKAWTFRGGSSATDIRRTLMTGLAGTPMPSYADSFENPEDSWHLANYVRSLAPERPDYGVVLKSQFISGELPDDPDDPRWKKVPGVSFPLVGQIIAEPRWFTPSIDMVSVKSLYNEKEIVFLLLWDDPTKSLPDPRGKALGDAVVIQFPSQVPEAMERPYFLMGDPERSVNLWRWSTDGGFQEVTASGLTAQAPQKAEQQEVTGKVTYQHGQYRLVLKRPLKTEDLEDLQFVTGRFIPIAFMAWDGSHGEAGGKMSLSSWYYLILEEPVPMVAYFYPPLATLLTAALGVLFVRRLRRSAGPPGTE